ncbi:similar to RIKEN cDNA 4931406C07, isoform CRA_a [Rattus norvegicus]|uniref:Similar to RIKEN cDNA 4931406C07, isoform CRA_a n=1 Tax=Rattus norvegicus TaxID=10116 RepID=A6JNB7_RAT|nr:similar to RIKEN cDNA 4931406C07, isoform CRA_a [Rattus norvegicus]
MHQMKPSSFAEGAKGQLCSCPGLCGRLPRFNKGAIYLSRKRLKTWLSG